MLANRIKSYTFDDIPGLKKNPEDVKRVKSRVRFSKMDGRPKNPKCSKCEYGVNEDN